MQNSMEEMDERESQQQSQPLSESTHSATGSVDMEMAVDGDGDVDMGGTTHSNEEEEGGEKTTTPPVATATSTSAERRKALEDIGRDAKLYWSSLPPEWKTDKEFILHALQESPHLPPKSDFERQFPQSLRFDKDVVLAFCHRPDFDELFHKRHLFVPGCLAGDKDVMMAYCRRIPRSLQECSEELCNDPDVVQAAISLGGLELQYASLRLQEDPQIVQQACQSHGRALEYCPPGPTRDALVSDRNFMKDVVLAKPGGGPMWKLAAPHLQQDTDLLLQALKHGLCLRDVPDVFAHNVDFILQALQVNATLYLQLTLPLQAQMDLARQAILAEDSTPEVHAKALQHCPNLKTERQVVLSLCKRGDKDLLTDLLQLPSSEPFVDDIDIMEAAVTRDSKLFALASPRLQLSPQLIVVSITPISAWNTLKLIPASIMRQHPEIPTRAVRLSTKRNLRHLQAHIPDDIWATEKPLCLAWLERGGRVLEAFENMLVVRPPYTPEDWELPLAIAKYNWSEFYKVETALRGHKEFMLQALALDGRVLRFALSNLRQDFDIQVMAVANHNNNTSNNNNNNSSTSSSTDSHPIHPPIPCSIHSTLGNTIDIPSLSQRVREKLQLHQIFCQDFLRGIAIVTPHQPPQLRSQLPMLDRGVETSQAFKRLIAEYVGVPFGPQLALLRRAQAHLDVSEELPRANVVGTLAEDDPTAASEHPHHWNIPGQRAAFVPPAALAGRRQRYRPRRRGEVIGRAREVVDGAIAGAGMAGAAGLLPLRGRHNNNNNNHHWPGGEMGDFFEEDALLDPGFDPAFDLDMVL